ncbi:hypothetical protein [Kitasatospora indigofera]|uniref:hypothetical protein n=1 Tax=Kitasatospora indigofera TaxID=67307 RepID=UPI0036A1007E
MQIVAEGKWAVMKRRVIPAVVVAVAIPLLAVRVILTAVDPLVEVPSADRSSVVAGRSVIKEWDSTNPGGADEYQISFLLLPPLAATGTPVPDEVSRLVAAGWAVDRPEGPDGPVSLLSPNGKSLLTLESTDAYVRRSAADSTEEPARRQLVPSAESNPGAVLAVLERIAR